MLRYVSCILPYLFVFFFTFQLVNELLHKWPKLHVISLVAQIGTLEHLNLSCKHSERFHPQQREGKNIAAVHDLFWVGRCLENWKDVFRKWF